MRRLGVAALCAVVALTVSVGVVANASAAPALFKCTSQTFNKFKWEDAQCSEDSEKDEGFFEKEELKAGEHVKFKVTTGTTVFKGSFDTITCTSGEGEEVTKGGKKEPETNGPEKVRGIMRYKGCKDEFGVACHSAGAETGEVATEPLEGYLFYIKTAAPVVIGVFFVAESGSIYAKFSCLLNVEMLSVEKTKLPGNNGKGSCLAGEITSLPNEMREKYTLSFAETMAHEQAVKSVKFGGVTFTCELEAKVGSNLQTVVTSSTEEIGSFTSLGKVLETR